MANIIPTVIAKTNNSERAYDIFSLLLKNRIIFLNGVIEDEMATVICAQLLYLESESADDIQIYINSPGGSVSAAFAIYDTMNFVKCDIQTFGIGIAASCASWILCSGTKGKRFALPNLRFMIHEPSGGVKGRSNHIEDYANEIMFMRKKLLDIYKNNSSASQEQLSKWFDRETFLSAQEALSFNFIDEIKTKRD